MSATAQSRRREAHIFAREEHDHYAEPLWVSERLFDVLRLPSQSVVVDPACGFGRIVRAAHTHGLDASGFDIVPRWLNQPDGAHSDRRTFAVNDFLASWPLQSRVDAIVSNPPFKDAQEFAERALERSAGLVAFLLPTKWVQGDRRSRWLESTPLETVMPIAPRPSMPPGQVWLEGGTIGGGTVDFSWFVWRKGYAGRPQIEWLRRIAS